MNAAWRCRPTPSDAGCSPKASGSPGDAHRAVGTAFNLAAILSLQQQRVVANDSTVRFENRYYQPDRPIYLGERGGKVVIEVRLDGSMAIRSAVF